MLLLFNYYNAMQLKKIFIAFILVSTVLSGIACMRQGKNTSHNNSNQNNTPIATQASTGESTPSVTTDPVSTNSTSSTQASSKDEGDQHLPPNWPWRGICLESKSTHPDDIDYLASIHVNFVRLQLKPSRRTMRDGGDPTKNFYKEIAWADSMLDKLKQHGMTSVLAFNFLVLDPKNDVDDKSSEFWKKPTYIDSTYKMVDIIARHFQSRGDELSCYEIIGEPALKGKGNAEIPSQIETFYQEVLKTIRKSDTRRWFLLTPGPWGRPTNYKDFKPYRIKDDKLIYGAHMYLPDAFTHQGVKNREKGMRYPGQIKNEFYDKSTIERKFKAIADFKKQYNYPIYIGEFQAARWSDGADIWVRDVLETIDDNGWGWSYFAFEAGQDFWDPYYDVANPKQSSEEWKIEYKGPQTKIWQYMISEYAKNKKK